MDGKPSQLTGFVTHFKGGMGLGAITTFIGIIFAILSALFIWGIHASEKTTRILIVLTCIIALLVFVIAKPRHISFKLTLLGYALVGAAIFVGFIYDDGRESYMRFISIGLFAVLCYIKHRFY
jgi:hypothetical protein